MAERVSRPLFPTPFLTKRNLGDFRDFLFQDPGLRRVALGKSQAETTRNPPFDMTNQDVLELSREAVQNLTRGTIESNLRKELRAKEVEGDEIFRKEREAFVSRFDSRRNNPFSGQGQSQARADELSKELKEVDEEILDLTRRVMEAASGKPAPFSLSAEREQQERMAQVAIANLLSGIVHGDAGNAGQSSGNSSSSPSNKDTQKTNQRSLTDDDLTSIAELLSGTPSMTAEDLERIGTTDEGMSIFMQKKPEKSE